MTDRHRPPIDVAMAHALDAFDVPPPGAGFLDRIAAMPPIEAPALPPLPRRRLFAPGRRGAWARRASIGVLALGLASATAAATGVFPQLHITLPAPIIAMLGPTPTAKPRPAHIRPHHVAPAPAVAATTAPPPPGAFEPMLPIADPVTRAIRREQVVDAIQNRLAARGVDVPKPVIRRQLVKRQIAIGAAIRGDTATPLPPGMERMRDRATEYLDAHPALRDRLRARAAAVDAAHRRASDLATGTDAPDAAPSWTQRRLQAFRRGQMMRQFWAAQRAPATAAVAAPENVPAPTEGNADTPR